MFEDSFGDLTKPAIHCLLLGKCARSVTGDSGRGVGVSVQGTGSDSLEPAISALIGWDGSNTKCMSRAATTAAALAS